MKFRIIAFALALGIATSAGAAVRHPSNNGLGIMLGSPSGLTFKHYFGGSNAFDIGFGVGPGVRLHADYLWGLAELARGSDATLDFYVGAGGLVGVGNGWCSWYDHGHDRWHHDDGFCHDDEVFFGARVPVGLDLSLRKAPLSFGLELAPGLVVSPHDADALIDAFFFARVMF